jgi:xanthine dehydrogenase accessory factor
MRDVLIDLETWWQAGETVGLGTVVGTWKSAPRQPGASMLVGPDGTAVGSVSGGCVEGAVYELAESTRASGEPVLQRYGVSDDDAFSVGLTCGGIIDIFVESIDRESFPELGDIAADIREGRPVAVATLISGVPAERLGKRLIVRPDSVTGTLGSERLDAAVGCGRATPASSTTDRTENDAATTSPSSSPRTRPARG